MQRCIQNCSSCHQICERTLSYCIEQGGPHVRPEHIKLLRDCIDICGVSADFMLRSSPFHMRTCGLCAEICEACAEDCEKMGQDAMMQACAAACRRCVESCRSMSAMH